MYFAARGSFSYAVGLFFYCVFFLCILLLGLQDRENSSKNHPKAVRLAILCFKVAILAPFWRQVGPQVGPKFNLAELGPNLVELGSILGRTWPQLGRTWLHLGFNLAPLGQILEPTWLQLGSKIQPKSVQNRSKSPKMASRPLQEGLGTDLGGFL